MQLDLTQDRRAKPPLAPGTYDFQIFKVKEGESQYGEWMQLTFKMMQNGNVMGFHKQFLSGSKEGDVQDLCKATGIWVDVAKSGKVLGSDLEGKEGTLHLIEAKNLVISRYVSNPHSAAPSSPSSTNDLPF